MQYREYGKTGFKVSALGMGCMRLPRIIKGENEVEVDREKSFEMIRYAADNGINYFDSAFTYHQRKSEEILGEALDGGRREKVMIATKQPFSIMANLETGGGKTILENARRNLENSLKKLRTSYIDIYLIHNIGTGNWEGVKQNKVFEEYEKFRAEGLIKAIGFSYHGQFPCFKEAVEYYDWDMCQVQQNFMDVDREVTEESIKVAGKKSCAVVIMEPLRGGGLALPPKRMDALYAEFPGNRKPVEWAFRHCLDYPEVSVILSGVTTLDQLKENIAIFSKDDSVPNCLGPKEKETIKKIKAAFESVKTIPCTTCEYCLPCPNGVDIPNIFFRYNEARMFETYDQPARAYMLLGSFKKDFARCTACGECEKKCPQKIEIIKQLKVAHDALKGWLE